MDVEHPPVPALNEFCGEQPHEAGEADQFDMVFIQRGLKLFFKGCAVLAERFAVDDQRGNPGGLGFLESRGVALVGDHNGNFGGKILGLRGVDQSRHVRATPGDQDCDALHRLTPPYIARSR